MECVVTLGRHWYHTKNQHIIPVKISDCNPGIEFSIPRSWIEKFVITGSHFRIRLTDLSLF